ncbi:3-oxoacyl-ACP reductase [Bacteroidia bacterium]|nr:3-oxoacyl-ACP reductase [Bacteroidia bacterium]
MYNPFSLAGKKILITGASSGLGRSIAVECTKMGASVLITGRNSERLNMTFVLLEGSGHQQVVADLSTEEGIENLVKQCSELDGVVHSAGIGILVAPQFIKRSEVENQFNTNTFAPILLTSLLVKNNKIKSGASFVFLSSIVGTIFASKAHSLYAASKGAIDGFVKGMALDLARKKIRVNSILPGLVPTEILNMENALTSYDEVMKMKMKMKMYPLQRFGRTEDIANGAIYLLSDASSWVTGSALKIDGGITLGGI